MTLRIALHQIDAVAQRPFSGTPAAVCPLAAWPADELLQQIAEENNMSETAFFVPGPDGDALRGFTPSCEVRRSGSQLEMDFPGQVPAPVDEPAGLTEALGVPPDEVLAAQDLLAVFPRKEGMRSLSPDFRGLMAMPLRGVIATAPGSSSDFVSRFFAPKAGIDEDPVSGSAHCALPPFWAARRFKDRLLTHPISRRGGILGCQLRGTRLRIRGHGSPDLRGKVVGEA